MVARPRKLEVNERFRHALQLMEHSDQSLFITGRAGTGKSTLLSHFCARTKKKPVILAPTGVAALNVKGSTIHKFFRFYVDVTPEKIFRKQVKPRNPKIYEKLQTIIIDEISMVRADLLDCVDAMLRMYGPKPKLPFGGVQMIFVGDLYQLPPVVKQDAESSFHDHYETPFFFSAHCLRDADFSVIELDKIYRQKEQHFVDILNRVRTASVTDDDIAALNARFEPFYEPKGDAFFIHLTTTNRKADEINDAHLTSLPGKVQSTTARVEGEFKPDAFPTAEILKFKRGAQIMLLNNDTQGRWVNGSVGVIESITRDEDDRAYVKVRLEDDDDLVHVYPHSWEIYKYGVEGGEITAQAVGSFTQFPFRLAWAVTIHKAQGKTFDHVLIDIDRGTFAAGQMYVALSRCTSLEGIVLKTRIAAHHITTDERIVQFLAAHPYVPPAEALKPDVALEAEVSPAEMAQPLRSTFAAAQELIAKLAQGIDPASSAALPVDSPLRRPDIAAALRAMATARAPRESGRRRDAAVGSDSKPTPPGANNHGKSWSEADRARVTERFKADISLKEIATELGRTTGSIRGELLRQGLITRDDYVLLRNEERASDLAALDTSAATPRDDPPAHRDRDAAIPIPPSDDRQTA